MSFFRRYVRYLRDNPEHYWFKRKIFGWGWTPATWEGWAILLIFIAIITANAFRLDDEFYIPETVYYFVGETAVLVLVLIYICYKTGEPPKWMWYFPPEKEDEE